MTTPTPLPDEAAAFLRGRFGGEWTVQPLAGDASVRAYFRIVRPDGTSYMLAYYPPELRPQLRRFLDAYQAVAAHGRIPDVLQHSEHTVLQADVGDRTLFDLLHDDRDEGIRRYRQAIELLVAFQKAGDAAINPPFTADFFAAELAMTREFYVEKLMGMPPDEAATLDPWFRTLSENVTRHPYVLCHRDYHGQNLHLFNDMIYVIDYQDLRMGPDTYDVASLLRDRGVARILGEETELALVGDYADLLGAGRAALRHRYFETLLQRSIKVLGTFSRQPIVRGRLHYLDFIPPAIEAIRRCLAELPEYAGLGRLLPMELALEETRERLRKEHHGQTQDHTPAG
ncbi:MAG: putative phosphotransferase related to Ser/Thr protein kinase [Acidobacteria bacterium]|nr:putative phosphotransferase related to Ser/Thr protein kinase [Acidobacteriota bacterium]